MKDETYEEYLARIQKSKSQPKGEEVRDLKTKEIHDSLKQKRKKKNITYTSNKEFDFLKYYIIVENYYLKVVFKNELQPSELKMLFFLYSEPPFTQADFKDYTELLFWNKHRLHQWIKKGFITEAKSKKRRNVKLYKVSPSTMRQIRGFYDRLVLRYNIPDSKDKNPMFRPTKRSYTDKRYAKKIKSMNKDYNDLQDKGTLRNKIEGDVKDCRSPEIREFTEDYVKGVNKEIAVPSPKTLNKKNTLK